MTSSVSRWAVSQRLGLPTRKLVLVCLASYADARGRAVVSQPDLAWACEMSEQTIRRVLRWLAAEGYVRREPPGPGAHVNSPRQSFLQLDRRPDGLRPGRQRAKASR